MSGGAGPPTGQTVHIPSNLEVDPNSWRSIVYTYSPVWEPPVEEEEQSMATGSTGLATTQEGDITVKSCYDPTENAVKLEVEWDIDMIGSELPWMSLGYRETSECLMNPRGGGDSEIILITNEEAHFTLLPTLSRSFDQGAVSSIYDNMVPLEEKEGFSQVELQTPTAASALSKSAQEGDKDSVLLHFKQSMPTTPDVMHLMYAIGSTPNVSYHKTRKCFDITEFPTCPVEGSTTVETTPATTTETTPATTESTSAADRTSLYAAFTGTMLVLLV